ncbi:WYL domain-containing protein [Streptobacillus canis]|nr:YafY family protein [Streptobacillus canis]
MYEKTFNDIKSAILSKNIVSFTYFSSNEKETSRRVKPVRLLFKSQDWYLYALCLLRNDFRYFKLSRIKNLEIHTEKFDDNFEDVILKKETPHENTVNIKVKFDRKVAFRVYDELNGEITEDNDGNLYTEIEIPNDYNLYNYIFSFGDEAEVLEPEEVRMQIKKMINKMAEKYII